MNRKYDLIDVSDDEDNISDTVSVDIVEEKINDKSIQITVIESNKTNSDAVDFICYCIDKEYFDDSFYSYSNIFSIIGTRLPVTFDKMSKNSKTIDKHTFCAFFGDYQKADVIFDIIDIHSDGVIDWEQFKEFFIPFIKNVSA